MSGTATRGRSSSRSGGSGSRSPTVSPPPRKGKSPMAQFMEMLAKTNVKDEDSKTIKIPPFSDGTDWESVVFELECGLEKYWKNGDLDIVDYLHGIQQNCHPDLITKPIKLSTMP